MTSAAESNGGSASSVDPSRRMSGGCKEPDAPLPSLSWPLSLCLDGRGGVVDGSMSVFGLSVKK